MNNIKKFNDFINEKKAETTKMPKKEDKELLKKYDIKITENLDNIDPKFEIIAAEVQKGFTSGEEPIEWELEVNVKDWVKLDDEDIDYIAAQIKGGKSEGNDPIDWSIDFVKDSFDIEEEEELTRGDIAKQMDMDEEDMEDSSELGDMADKLIDDDNTYEYALDEAEILFNAFKDTNDISHIFTDVIGDEFKYDKENYLFKHVIEFYPEFKEEVGHLDEFGTPLFNMALKEVIKKYVNQNISEKKKNETSEKIKPVAIFQEKNKKGEFVGNKIYYYTCDKNTWFVTVGKEFKGSDIPKKGSGKTGQWKNKKEYPSIKSLEEYHKNDNIFKI